MESLKILSGDTQERPFENTDPSQFRMKLSMISQ